MYRGLIFAVSDTVRSHCILFCGKLRVAPNRLWWQPLTTKSRAREFSCVSIKAQGKDIATLQMVHHCWRAQVCPVTFNAPACSIYAIQ